MSVVDLLTDEHERQRQTQRVVGVAVGVVTNNQDPQGLGRVRVKFPWLSDGTESDWTKVVSFMAGNNRGAVFLPEVNDEVLVAFEHGDVNFPYVLGGLWNSKDPPPEKNQDGRNNVRKIRSRSGHEIAFHDDKSSQQEQLEIRTNAGHSILLSDAVGVEQVVIKDKSGNNLVKIDSLTNSISMESSMKISIKSQIVEIEAGTIMTIKANGVLTIQGTVVKLN
jgi:uncharacterized protein involved in type VI secretion and phage assembly